MHLNNEINSLPEAKRAGFEVLSLPFGPYVKHEDVEKIVAKMKIAHKLE